MSSRHREGEETTKERDDGARATEIGGGVGGYRRFRDARRVAIGSAVLAPLVKMVAPRDTYAVTCANGKLRVDGELRGIDSDALGRSVLPKWRRGKFSLIFNRGARRTGRALVRRSRVSRRRERHGARERDGGIASVDERHVGRFRDERTDDGGRDCRGDGGGHARRRRAETEDARRRFDLCAGERMDLSSSERVGARTQDGGVGGGGDDDEGDDRAGRWIRARRNL